MFKMIADWTNAIFDVFVDWLSGASEEEYRDMDEVMRFRH